MRSYFFGDLHGNSDALEACLGLLDSLKVDRSYCLGDLVGWLPFGDRTLLRMRSLGFPTVAGNHDLMVAGVFVDHRDQVDRMQATAYNAGLLSTVSGALDYLSGLPLMLEEDDFTVVHHSPFHLPKTGAAPTIECFSYLDEPAIRGCLQAWATFPRRLIFSGHDHVPAVYELKEVIESPSFEDIKVYRPSAEGPLTLNLKPRRRYWVKAGSVGGPYRDGTPAANSVLYDDSSQTLTLFRIPYSTSKLQGELASHRFCRQLPTLQRYLDLLKKRVLRPSC